MTKNNEFHMGTGFPSPVSSHSKPQSLPRYRRLGETCVLAGISDSGSGSDNSVETASDSADFDQNGKFEQINIFVKEAIAPCQSCGSTRINLVKMPDFSAHYAARRCGQCDLFRGWEPKPSTKDKRQQQQSTISELLKSPQLSQWERNFLEGLKGRKISPKQREILVKIEVEVGGAA